MTASLLRFYQAVSQEDDYECGAPDYKWVLRHIEDQDHPIYGPPLPWSLRPNFDRILHDIYGPAIREAINNTKPFWRQLGVHGVD